MELRRVFALGLVLLAVGGLQVKGDPSGSTPASAAGDFKMPFDQSLHPPLTGGPHRQAVLPSCASAVQPVSTLSGIDIALGPGSAVLAVADGSILRTGFEAGGFGNYVVARAGSYQFTYAHLSTIRAWVRPNVPISQGDIL